MSEPRDRIREAAQELFELWKEYQEQSEAPEAEGLKDSWNARERACGVAAALMRMGYRIETHYALVKAENNPRNASTIDGYFAGMRQASQGGKRTPPKHFTPAAAAEWLRGYDERSAADVD